MAGTRWRLAPAYFFKDSYRFLGSHWMVVDTASEAGHRPSTQLRICESEHACSGTGCPGPTCYSKTRELR